MFEKPWQWIRDLFFTAIYMSISVLLGVLLLAVLIWVTGLHRVFF